MKCCILQKVPYRLPGTNRLVWSVILTQREGLTLLFVRKPDDKRSHAIVIGAENVNDRCFEEVKASTFPLEYDDLTELASKLHTLGEGVSEDDFLKFLKSDSDWMD